MSFKIIEKKEDIFEIRKYNPQKRFINISNKEYWLPFPYIIFGWRKFENRSFLYMAFAKEDDEFVYFPSIPNISGIYWAVCLGGGYFGGGGHYMRDEKDITESINRFWQSSFALFHWRRSKSSLSCNYGTFHSWQKLTVKRAVVALEFGKEELNNFIEKVKNNPSKIILT